MGPAITDDEWERRARLPAGQDLLAAARRVICRRGVRGASFPVIAQEAGQSHSLPAYYFGTKERLLLALVEADALARLDALRECLSPARSFDELLAGMDRQLVRFLDEEVGSHVVLAELESAALHTPALRDAELHVRRRWRETLAGILTEKESAGIVALPIDALATASLLTALGEGIAREISVDPDSRDSLLVAVRENTRRLLEPGSTS